MGHECGETRDLKYDYEYEHEYDYDYERAGNARLYRPLKAE